MIFMRYKILYNEELYHHGVKGMKWGVRKNPQEAARQRVAKEGGSEYSLHYGRFGGTSIRNASGKKMGRGTQRALEKSMKARDVQQYREYKRYKRSAQSGMTYVGNSASTAMMVSVLNSATQASRDSAQDKQYKMLIDEGNRYARELLNGKR